MLRILNNYCNKENGLLLFDPPTGSGKTYAVLEWIFENYNRYCIDNKKIFFVTNLKKNLPFDELRDSFFKPNKKLAEFEKDVVFLDSNSDCLIKRFEAVENNINPYFKSNKVFNSIKKNISLINNYNNNSSFNSFVFKLKEEIRKEFEPEFRKIIENYLKDNFNNKQERIKAIQKNNEFKWIGELYPAVFTSKRKIVFLSIDKFYYKNSTLVEPSYSFLESDLTKDAIIFIDEIDATKENILKNIIEKGKDQKVDYIHLFTEIYWALSKNIFPQKFTTHSRKRQELIDNNNAIPLDDVQKVLLEKSEEIVNKYHLSYSFKTQNIDNEKIDQRNLLFNDFHYHSVYRNNKKFIHLHKNDSLKLNEIVFEETRPDGEGIVHLLNQIKGFVNYFSIVIKSIAENYWQLEEENEQNRKRQEFTFDLALSTVIEEFALDDKDKSFLIDNILSAREKRQKRQKKKDALSFDDSVYENGFRYYDFVDDDSHQSKTKTYIYSFHNTPEKFLLKLAEKSKVIGISATSKIETVTGNYDMSYFKRQLGPKFLELNSMERKILTDLFKEQNKHYSKINIHTEWVGINNIETDFEKLFGNKELARDIVCEMKNFKTSDYDINRYYKISYAFKQFLIKPDIKGFLCLLNKEPKQNDKRLDLNLLEKIFENLIAENELTNDFNVKNAYTVINSNEFDSKKQGFIETLESGKKIFIISMYQTIGAGQNLQFIAPEPEELIDIRSEKLDKRNKEKKTDINAIYLDKPTHIIQKIDANLDEEGFIKYLFQLEFLLHVGIISVVELNSEITRAFKYLLAYPNNKEHLAKSKVNLYKNKSIKQHYCKYIIQAIGRICRTNLKSSNIYIYADKELDELICDFDTENTLVLNEFKALVNSSKQNIKSKQEEDIRFKNLATTTNMKVHKKIQEFISSDEWGWDEKDVNEWQRLREMCLCFPTISEEEVNGFNLNRILDLYIELPEVADRYYFSMKESDFYNDYKCVAIDFKSKMKREVSTKSVRLDELMEIDGVREFFNKRKWKTEFKKGKYIMPPVMVNNIYKGALGEQIGKFIFENHFEVALEELSTDYFEMFDFKIKGTNIYIDFKHWRETTEINFGEQEFKIREKLKKLQGEKVFIINILSNEEWDIVKSADGKIVEVPYLWNAKKRKFNEPFIKEMMNDGILQNK